MCFDGGATGCHRVPRFGQGRSFRRSNFGRTGPQADVDVQAVGGCWLLRGRARRVRFCGWAAREGIKRQRAKKICTPCLILPHVKKWGRNYLDALQPWQIEKSVTYVAGLKCYLCRRSFKCLARGIREGMLRVRGWYNSADAIARYPGRPAASFVRRYQSESALGTGWASFRGTRKSVLA